MPSIRTLALLLAGLAMFGPFSIDTIFPAFPQIGAQLGADKLAKRIKAVRLTLTGAQGLERAISSAGGVRLAATDDRLMLAARPGVFAAGEMLDWGRHGCQEEGI